MGEEKITAVETYEKGSRTYRVVLGSNDLSFTFSINRKEDEKSENIMEEKDKRKSLGLSDPEK